MTATTNPVTGWIIAILAVLFFLRAAKSLMIPIAIAILLSYALAPVVRWLERYRIPKLVGAGLVILFVVGLGATGAYAIRDDARHLAAQVPKALERARELVRSQLGTSGPAIEEATRVIGGITETADSHGPQQSDGASPADSLVGLTAGAVVSLAGHMVVVLFLIYFLLIYAHQVRDRVIEISGSGGERRQIVSTIIDDINIQVQRYLLVLLFTALVVGISTWLVLALMRVQQAAMWGILAGLFNSIPYFGPVIVSGGLFIVGLAQGGGGVTQALQMSGASIVITSLEGWLLTPALMGKAERMSALAVFLGLLLWTWVWGAWGTLLAVPMLVVIKSVADHVDALRPLGRLMAP